MINIKLGSIIREVVEKTTVNNQYPVLTSSQNGLVTQDEYFNKQIASQNNIGYKVIKKGQFTYRAMSDTGRFYINQSPHEIGIVSPAYPVFEIITSDDISSEYIAMYFKSEVFQNVIALQSTGSTRVSLKLNKVKDLELEIPNIEKQRDILNHIHKMDSLIIARREQLAKLDELVKARFVELFGDLMLNPHEWPVMKISDVSLLLKSGLSRKLSDDDIGLPVIRSGNIQNGQFIYDDVKYWYKDDPQGSKTADYILEDGDILVNFINSASQIGKTAIFRAVGRDCIYTTNIFRMKLAENCNEYYYNWFAMSDYYYRQLQNIIQPAVNQASFTTVNFLKLNIPLPPMELQKQFADFVKQTDKSKLEVQKSLEKLELLKNALMQKYFG